MFKHAARGPAWTAALFGSTVVVLGLPRAAAAAGPEPGKLLVYYGYPSAVNATFTVPLAAEQFGAYDHVILGDGLQDGPADPNPHPDHQNTIDIMAHPAAANARFHGYIDIGVTTQSLDIGEIERRVDAWEAMGVDGIFLDDYGYDFGTTRERQNTVVEYVHSRGLPATANGFFVDDVFGQVVHANNPGGLPTSLAPDDFYFFESHQVSEASVVAPSAWYAKAERIRMYQVDIGFGVLSVTTNNALNAYDAANFFYSWHSAALYGHVATGWGEYLFSASGVSNSLAPFRARPKVTPGSAFAGQVVVAGSRFTRATDAGLLFVDAFTRGFGFVPADAPDADQDGVADLLDACGDTPAGTPVDAAGRPVGDIDRDCDVDLDDFRLLQQSFTGLLQL
jgi:hypothetical protein